MYSTVAVSNPPPPPYSSAPDELEILLGTPGPYHADYTNLSKHPATTGNGVPHDKVRYTVERK